jgi:anti-sigma-K factor RskA
MTDTPLTPDEEIEALAAEYVLGVLDLPERQKAEKRLKKDKAFAARVASWEERLSGLNDGFAESPAPDLLPKIEARLFPTTPRRRGWVFQWLSGLVVASAVVAAAVMLVAPPNHRLVTVLATGTASLGYEVRHFGNSLTVTRIAGEAAAPGSVHELWIIAPDAAPVSLGLLEDKPLEISYPAPPAGWTMAVSVEPAGGSPTGAPTGPIILNAVIPAQNT